MHDLVKRRDAPIRNKRVFKYLQVSIENSLINYAPVVGVSIER